MNPLVHNLPETFEVDGVSYKVKTSHRSWLQVARLLDSEITPLTLPLIKRNIGLEDVEIDNDILISKVGQFLAADDERPYKKQKKRVFCWDQDAHRVISDFQHEYGIDLTNPKVILHWYRFCYLFQGLSEDSEVKSAIRWRSTPEPEGKHMKQERKQWKAMQKAYKLYPRTEAEAIEQAEREFNNV